MPNGVRETSSRLPVPAASVKLERRTGGGKSVTKFNPKQTRMKLGALKEGVKLAAKIKDWEGLEAAIDGVIEEQRAFVAWWEARVTPGHGAGRGNKNIADGQSFSVADATGQTGVTAPQVSKWRNRLRDESAYREVLRDGAYVAMWALRTGARGTTGTGDNEWYTPAEYLNRARSVLGAFDLDPASSTAAQKLVGAAKFFIQENDGLKQEWHGRVWLNPPYAQPLIAEFIDKLIAERGCRHVTAAITLTHNYTDTAWFQDLAAVADAICFTRGRVRFVDANGELASPTQGQAFCYLGSERGKFISEFVDVGIVVVRP